MNILLLGYGKMGKTIEAIALERGHAIVGKVDNEMERAALDLAIKPDVAIEFSMPEVAVDNIKFSIDRNIPIVCGTTGWLASKEEVEKYCLDRNSTLFYTSNFSLGVNIFFKLNEFLAKLMNRHREYTVTVDETHHTQKKDTPSGTAISLAEGIIRNLSNKKDWTNEPSSNPDSLVINSYRVDPAPGTHTVKYKSAIDDIEITHTAHSRQGFALGAVLVAEWIKDKKGILNMEDFFNLTPSG
ncbi:MAG: 4-hydroxy-tetrahydrodipicolinate reductase [Bacteroidia bacterium]|nr:4-hydroxy-tetrahydrodipicolinate reductase [Bacteroidia bacterium]